MIVAGSGGAGSEAGTAGAPGAIGSGDPLAIASAFAAFRWEFPCAGSAFVTDAACSYDLGSWKSAGGTVDESNGIEAELTRTFGGNSDTVYAVTLRFRGVAEGNMYKHEDGMLDAEMTTGPHFHVGGSVHEHFQVYSLAVSEPPQHFYLNAFHDLVTPLPVDYTATIQVRGGATLTFGMADTNTACFANSKQVVVAELPPAPAPFNGQFIQADVVSVTPAP
jgi:hypothetical protein